MLPEIVEAVGDKIDVLFDSGIRTGVDIIKALSLGAKGVLIGRPWVYGLGAGGKGGAKQVLQGILAVSLPQNDMETNEIADKMFRILIRVWVLLVSLRLQSVTGACCVAPSILETDTLTTRSRCMLAYMVANHEKSRS